jgi:hypothetical protein
MPLDSASTTAGGRARNHCAPSRAPTYKDPAISSDAFFGNLTRIRNLLLPGPVRRALATPIGLLGGFIVVHLVFLTFAASLSMRGDAFSDTFI